MITTVLASEEYLFTPREVWVLRHIVQMPCEPPALRHDSLYETQLIRQTSPSTS